MEPPLSRPFFYSDRPSDLEIHAATDPIKMERNTFTAYPGQAKPGRCALTGRPSTALERGDDPGQAAVLDHKPRPRLALLSFPCVALPCSALRLSVAALAQA